MLWQIQGTVVKIGEWNGAKTETIIQIPTFYLHQQVQMFLDKAGAEKVAASVVNPTSDEKIVPHLYAYKMPD